MGIPIGGRTSPRYPSSRRKAPLTVYRRAGHDRRAAKPAAGPVGPTAGAGPAEPAPVVVKPGRGPNWTPPRNSSACIRATPIATRRCATRTWRSIQAHDGEDKQPVVPAAADAGIRGAGALHARAPLPRLPTNRSQRHTMEGTAPSCSRAAGGWRRRRGPGAELPDLPPDLSLPRATSRRRHRDGDHGCAKDIASIAACRGYCSAISAGQCAGKPRDRACSADARGWPCARSNPPRRRHHGAVAARLERAPEWKLDYSNPARASPEELARARQNG